MFIPHDVSHVSCHVSHSKCHMSSVTCHISCVTCFFFKSLELIVGGLVINGAYPVQFYQSPSLKGKRWSWQHSVDGLSLQWTDKDRHVFKFCNQTCNITIFTQKCFTRKIAWIVTKVTLWENSIWNKLEEGVNLVLLSFKVTVNHKQKIRTISVTTTEQNCNITHFVNKTA